MKINHRKELESLDDDLLEKIAHHCKGEIGVTKGYAIAYHRSRLEMATKILTERKLKSMVK